MTNPIIQTDIADLLQEIKSDQKEILQELNTLKLVQSEEINALKLGQAKTQGKIESLNEKLSGQINALDTKVDQLDKRISNSEFTNRGILIGLVVIILGGAAKLFGLMGSS